MVDILNRPEHSPEDLPYRTELSGILRDGVEAVREEPDGSESLARVLENARDIGQRKPKRRPPWTRRLLVACGVAAVVLVLAMVGSRGDSKTWAQVAAALAGKPWIHGKGTYPCGTEVEFWFSADRGVKGVKIGGAPYWVDYHTKTRTDYDARNHRLICTRDFAAQEDEKFYAAAFRSFLSGEFDKPLEMGERKIACERVDTRTNGIRSWLEYRLALSNKGVKESQWIVYVDPETHLPFRWDQLGCEKGLLPKLLSWFQSRRTMALDYPDSGPADIYALGVPKNVTGRLELVPDPDQPELARLDTAIKTAAAKADHYKALAVNAFGDQHWSYATGLDRIWRDGKRWKIDHSYGRVTQSRSDKTGPDDADREARWRRQAAKARFRPQERCDGYWLWEYRVKTRAPTPAEIDRGVEKNIRVLDSITRKCVAPMDRKPELDRVYRGQELRPETLARPRLTRFSNPPEAYEIRIDNEPDTGPENTVLVELRDRLWNPADSRKLAPWKRQAQIKRFWVDTKRGHLVMRSEELVTFDGEEELLRGTVIEGVVQSPQGDWYPTVVRRLKCVLPMNAEPGEGDAGDIVIRYYYDFDAEMPDSLFESDGEYELGPRRKDPDGDASVIE